MHSKVTRVSFKLNKAVVPEFGLIAAAIAAIGGGLGFVFVRRRRLPAAH